MSIKKSVLSFLALFLSAVAAFATTDITLQMQAGNPNGATADSSNHQHYLMQRAQYALDFSDTLGNPNWVSWDLTANDHGSVSRSPSFFPDPDLPAGFYAVTDGDYTGVGNASVNLNRGHMSPSADRNDTVANNTAVFYMTNILPQAADNNQGPWEVLEDYCRTLASAGNELLITSGGFQYLGTKIPSGKAWIPSYVWKIILVIPTGSGTAASRATASTRVIAVKMPNINGIKANSWETYKTTVAQISADTGYTFFTGLSGSGVAAALRAAPVDGAPAVASPIINTQPTAQAAPVGSTVTFSVTADANGNPPLTYQWRKDGDEISTATNATLTLTGITATSGGNYSVVVSNTVGATASTDAALVVTGLPPSITTDPVAKSTPAGTAVSFTVVASGSPTLSYQWRQGTTNLTASAHYSGVTAPTLTINDPQAADALGYNVVVTNTVSSATSNSALLTVTPAAPTITGQPLAQTVAPAGTAIFTVTASGTKPFTYQWFKGSTPIDGGVNASALTASLTLPNLQLSDQDSYSVTVSNGIGTAATSNAAALTVSAAVNAKAYTGGTYTQNFDTLPTSGTFTLSGVGPFAFSAAPFNIATLAGWSIGKTSGTGTNELFNIGTGSANSGSIYSFGSATAPTDRALGALLSAAVGSSWGLVLTNNTGTTITQFTISYTGEQWRYGAGTLNGTDRVVFEYQVGGTDLLSGTFTPATALDFTSRVNSSTAVGTAGALDGNNAANRAAITSTITGITWAPGQALVLRFRDTDVGGSDDGLAIDDFSFSTPVNSSPTAPTVVSTTPVNNATNVAVATPITVTFDQPVNVTGTWFALSSTNAGSITPTVNTTDFTTFTFTPPSNLAFGDTVSLNLFAAQITEKNSGTLHPASNTTLTFSTLTPTPPGIGNQPSPSTVAAGSNAIFAVTATGTAPLAYQWRKGGNAISGNTSATTATLTLTNVQASDMANYDVVVTNGINPSATSNAVALTVTPAAPTITTQPLAQNAVVNGTATFTVAATGTTPFTYQWSKGVTPLTDSATISGSQSATLTLTGLATGDTGSYSVVVSNGVGTPATSNSVQLNVSATAVGQVAYAGGSYTQNFNTLPATGNFTLTGTGPIRLDDSTGINATGMSGWSLSKYAGTGANALFKFDNGGLNSGSVYSYGVTADSDRALGSLSSAAVISRFGVTLVNTTSHTLNQFTLSYTGEQWRHGGATTANKLAFSYGLGATDINTGTFVDTASLDFTGLFVTATGAALVGNDAANHTAITATINGLSWAPGQTLVLRWTDVDDSGSDDGLAIDDLTFSAIAPATVALSGLTPTYDGTAKAVTATTTPASLAVAITYNGFSTVPTAAGSYAVVATVTESGYSGSTTGTLVIGKAAATVALSDLAPTYDGTAKSVTVTTTPASLATSVTYNASATVPTNAGSYAIVATITDPNYTGSNTGTLVIGQATATVALGGLTATYDGTAKSVTVTTTPASLATSVTYNASSTAPTNAGTYAVVATITDPNYTGSTSDSLVIAKAIAGLTVTNTTQTYTGSPASAVTVVTSPVGLSTTVTYNGSGSVPTAAGAYPLVVTIVDANYTGISSGSFVINKAVASVTLGSLSPTYTGSALPATATTVPASLTVTFTYNASSTPPVNAGSYAVVGTVNDANYAGTATGTLTIAKATPVITWSAPSPITYGTALSGTQLNASPSVAGAFTYSPVSGTVLAAGPQTLATAFTPTDSANYNSVPSTTVSLTVQKAPLTVTAVSTSRAFGGTNPTFTATISGFVNGEVLGTSDVTGLAAASSAATTLSPVGTYPITASIGTLASLNYSFSSFVDGVLTVTPAALTVAGVTIDNKVYDRLLTATPRFTAATLTGVAAGDTANVSLVTTGGLASFADKTAATAKPVTVTGLTLGGSSATNYTLSQPTGLTANITTKPLTVSGITAANRVYDATTTATLTTTNAALVGIVPGDTVTLNKAAAAGAFASKTVAAAKVVQVSGLALGTEPDAANYSLTQPTTTADITAKTLTVAGVTAASKVYDGNTNASVGFGSATLVGIAGSDVVTINSSAATGAFATAGVGIGKTVQVAGVALAGADAANYVVTQPTATASITTASVNIAITNLSQTYDGTAKSVAVSIVPSAAASVVYSGSGSAPTDAGSYTVSVNVTDNNYSGNATATLTIAKASQTVAVGTVPANLTVGTAFTLSPTASSGLPVTLSVVSGNASVSGSSVTLSDGSPVTLRATQAGNNNYNPATADTTVTASKASQTITFAAIADQVSTAAPLTLSATASSNLPVTFSLVSGPATLSGSTLTLAGTAGTVTVRAAQAGNAAFNAAANVDRSFAVTVATAAPKIVSQPTAQVGVVGGSATFTVGATGTPAPTYQWHKDGANINGATGAALTLSNLTAADAAGYDVTVTNSAGSVTSSLASLTVNTTPTAPVITRQPGSLAVLVGRTATFSVAASGSPTPTYQWSKNGTAITGATGPAYSIGSVVVGDAGTYSVVVSNSVGSVTSSSATLGVIRSSFAGTYFGSLGNGGSFAMYIKDDNTGIFLGFLPGSSTAFVSRAVSVDDNGHFSFSVPLSTSGTTSAPVTSASGFTPFAQIEANDFALFDGSISSTGSLSTSTSSTYTLAATKSSATGSTASSAGFYQAGAAGSSAQTLAIVSPAGQAFVVTQNGTTSDAGTGTVDSTGKITVTTASNAKVTANVSGDAALTATVTTSGGASTTFTGLGDNSSALAQQRIINISTRTTAGTGDQVAIVGFVITGLESKPVLIRAVGPALRNFGVTTALAAPRLDLRSNSGALLATNTGWGTSGTTAEIANAAILAGAFPLAAGSADSVIITTLAPGNYTAVVTASDGKPGVGLVEVYDLSGPSTLQKLANLSTRAAVGTGDATLISGLVVSGSTPKRVLIRAAGPALTQFGVAGALTRPVLTLFSGSTVIATNTGWTTSTDSAAITSGAASVGAFAFAAGSADSALIVNLAPGAYTAQVTGASGATGTTLLEVYELP